MGDAPGGHLAASWEGSLVPSLVSCVPKDSQFILIALS